MRKPNTNRRKRNGFGSGNSSGGLFIALGLAGLAYYLYTTGRLNGLLGGGSVTGPAVQPQPGQLPGTSLIPAPGQLAIAAPVGQSTPAQTGPSGTSAAEIEAIYRRVNEERYGATGTPRYSETTNTGSKIKTALDNASKSAPNGMLNVDQWAHYVQQAAGKSLALEGYFTPTIMAGRATAITLPRFLGSGGDAYINAITAGLSGLGNRSIPSPVRISRKTRSAEWGSY